MRAELTRKRVESTIFHGKSQKKPGGNTRVGNTTRALDLRIQGSTGPPSYALGYCVKLNMKKKYQSY
jgi:hypothetical protein